MKLSPPSLLELAAEGAGAIEIICQVQTCKRASTIEIDQFSKRETVFSIKAKARCRSCGNLNADVFPVWNRTEQFSKFLIGTP